MPTMASVFMTLCDRYLRILRFEVFDREVIVRYSIRSVDLKFCKKPINR
ncbi:hypothetical protein FPSE_09744 [Fusarium pseudograminearum CS3096]|uniref:Uncharacterized protein n=1 Tax=Fusarium pseudograminearum (strain CS3096) TaxID=1028729 RepID=K3V9H9_FUSPC|nr:hypothetical protein FPSE_09744 [Fusarium pseudograminearum CS3096]EKJ70084.1 hypothetical protein FPSE_09744 [Fusarium pseudograminearum CS3096]